MTTSLEGFGMSIKKLEGGQYEVDVWPRGVMENESAGDLRRNKRLCFLNAMF